MSGLEIARQQLTVDEGVRARVYSDTIGIPTIGVGRNLRDVGLSQDEISLLFENDLSRAAITARKYFPGLDTLSDERQAVLINMAFNLGAKLFQFRDLQNALNSGDFYAAAIAILNSAFARQTGARAVRLAYKMKED